MRLVFPFLLSTFIMISGTVHAQSVRSVLDKMYQGIGSSNVLSYDMNSSERIGSKMVTKNMAFRLQISPRKVYMKDKDSGVELLYVAGWNSNQPFINPSGFSPSATVR